jgi:hypothetical protein
MLGLEERCPLRPVETVDQQVEAYNARDLDAFLRCYSPEAVIENLTTGETVMRGQDEMRRAYGELFSRSPRLRAEVMTRIEVGEYVVDEERVRGAHGSNEVRRAVAIYHVAGEAIDHVRFLFELDADSAR